MTPPKLDLAPLRQRWAALSPRERVMVGLAGAALLVLVLWYALVLPAWATWRTAPAQLAETEALWLRMQAQASEARELATQTPISPAQSRQALQAATERLGAHAQLQLVADRATVTLNNLPVTDWRKWLGELRQGARARPLEADLHRSDAGLSGRIVLQLPAAAP